MQAHSRTARSTTSKPTADARLIELGRQFEPLSIQWFRSTVVATRLKPDDPEFDRIEAEHHKLTEVVEGLLEQMVAEPATTPEGIRLKAMGALWSADVLPIEIASRRWSGQPEIDPSSSALDLHQLTVWSLCRDLARTHDLTAYAKAICDASGVATPAFGE